MKTSFRAITVITAFFLLCFITNSCKKVDDGGIDLPKEQLIAGKWNINRIQLKIYNGSVFLKDTIIPQHPHPENFVNFDNGSFEYRFNSYTSSTGTYQFVGSDSLVSNSSPSNYRWKMLTLTKVLFTIKSTGTDPAYPGATVETYHTLVR